MSIRSTATDRGPQEHPQRDVPVGTGVAPLETTDRSSDEQQLLTPRLVATGDGGPGQRWPRHGHRSEPVPMAPARHRLSRADSRHEALEQREQLCCAGT